MNEIQTNNLITAENGRLVIWTSNKYFKEVILNAVPGISTYFEDKHLSGFSYTIFIDPRYSILNLATELETLIADTYVSESVKLIIVS